jgi:hypothetical protein
MEKFQKQFDRLPAKPELNLNFQVNIQSELLMEINFCCQMWPLIFQTAVVCESGYVIEISAW